MQEELLDPEPEKRQRPPRNKILGAVLIAAGLLIVAIFGFDWNVPGKGPSANLPVSPDVGFRAPEFEAVNIDGKTISLSDTAGKVVLINFWATWCSPCRIEMPSLQARHERYPDDLVILAVDFDEPAELVSAFAEEFNLSFDVLLDPGGEIQQVFEIRAYPTSYFLDREGVVRAVHIGVLSDSQLDGYLNDLGLQ